MKRFEILHKHKITDKISHVIEQIVKWYSPKRDVYLKKGHIRYTDVTSVMSEFTCKWLSLQVIDVYNKVFIRGRHYWPFAWGIHVSWRDHDSLKTRGHDIWYISVGTTEGISCHHVWYWRSYTTIVPHWIPWQVYILPIHEWTTVNWPHFPDLLYFFIMHKIVIFVKSQSNHRWIFFCVGYSQSNNGFVSYSMNDMLLISFGIKEIHQL